MKNDTFQLQNKVITTVWKSPVCHMFLPPSHSFPSSKSPFLEFCAYHFLAFLSGFPFICIPTDLLRLYYSRTCLSLHFVPKFFLLAVCKSTLFTALWYFLVESCQDLSNAVGSWAPSSFLLLQCYEHPWYHRHVFLWCTSSKWNS